MVTLGKIKIKLVRNKYTFIGRKIIIFRKKSHGNHNTIILIVKNFAIKGQSHIQYDTSCTFYSSLMFKFKSEKFLNKQKNFSNPNEFFSADSIHNADLNELKQISEKIFAITFKIS